MTNSPWPALDSVVAYVPPTAVPIAELREELGVNDTVLKVYRRFHDLHSVRLDRSVTVVDLLYRAARQLDLTGRADRVRYLLHARTAELVGPHSGRVLTELRRRLGLHRCTAFAVSQHACASSLLALHMAGTLLAADGDPDALALIVTGEKAYPHMMRHMAPVTVLGDGSAACLVRLGADRDVLRAYATRTYGDYRSGLVASAELLAAYQHHFVAYLADIVRSALDSAGVTIGDLALMLPINTARIAWVQLCRAIGFPVERVLLENVPRTGHCLCADPFINYVTADPSKRLAPGRHYLMVSVGQGGVFSAAVFRR